MYPNLYYVFKDWFGVEWQWLSFLNTFGIMVALSFVAAAVTLYQELKRKGKLNLFVPREEMITVGKPASISELVTNGIVGFLFGYKLLGLLFSKPASTDAQDYIFSSQGNLLGGLGLAAVLVFFKWYDKNKQKLKTPENRQVRIWPHDRVGDFTIIALIGGLLGAKLFDAVENNKIIDIILHPIDKLLSGSGLTFYGGLIVASVAVCWYAYKKKIKLTHLIDAAAPGLILAYAIGRIGCQVAGDGDWGVYNTAYTSDSSGHVVLAQPADFENKLKEHETYFKLGVTPGDGIGNGREYATLANVPHKNFKAPSFIPTWMVAYCYPQNVNNDGIKMPGITDKHNKALPTPVFPTPFYETVLGLIIFAVLWALRKKLKVPGTIFALYLILNGIERFLIETIRVNDHYPFLGFQLSQAQIIGLLLVIGGIAFWLYLNAKNKKTN